MKCHSMMKRNELWRQEKTCEEPQMHIYQLKGAIQKGQMLHDCSHIEHSREDKAMEMA